jgi:hypothetical protein
MAGATIAATTAAFILAAGLHDKGYTPVGRLRSFRVLQRSKSELNSTSPTRHAEATRKARTHHLTHVVGFWDDEFTKYEARRKRFNIPAVTLRRI